MILKEEFIQDGKRYTLKKWVKDLIFGLEIAACVLGGIFVIFFITFSMFLFA